MRAARVVPLLLVLAAVLASGAVLLRPGYIGAVDVWPHMVRQQVVYEALKAGTSPFYTFQFYCGYPLLRFYGPLFAFLGGGMTFLTGGDPLPALKFLLFALHLLSGVMMYVFLRRRAGPEGAALGAAMYVLMPWRLITLVTVANFPQALVYVLLPFSFFALDRFVKTRRVGHAALVALALGLAAVSHLVYAAVMAVLLLTALPLLQRERQPGRLWLGLAVTVFGGLGIAAFFVVPFVAEYGAHAYPVLGLQVPLPDLRVLLLPWNQTGGYAGFYFGAGAVLMILAAATVLRRRLRGFVPVMLIGMLLSLVLTFVLPRLGALPHGLPPGRSLLFLVFCGSALAGLGFGRVSERIRSPNRRLVLLGILVAVLCADGLPSIYRIRYMKRERTLPVRSELYPLVGPKPSARVLDLYNHAGAVDDYPRLSVYPSLGYIFGGLGSVLGPPYHQFAPRSMEYVYPWANLLATDLGDARTRGLSPASRKALALMGATHAITIPVTVRSDKGGAYVMTKQGIQWDDRFVKADRKPPLVFGSTGSGIALASCVLRPVPDAARHTARTLRYAGDWRQLLDGIELNQADNSISAIPVRGRECDSLPGTARLVVTDVVVRHDEVKCVFSSTGDCYVRLAVSYYPYLEVLLDRVPVRFHPTADNFVYFRCPAGTHTVRVRAPLGSLRKATMVVSVVSLLGCIGLAIMPGRRRRKKGGS